MSYYPKLRDEHQLSALYEAVRMTMRVIIPRLKRLNLHGELENAESFCKWVTHQQQNHEHLLLTAAVAQEGSFPKGEKETGPHGKEYF